MILLMLLISSPLAAGTSPQRTLSVWLPYWAMDKAYTAVLAHADLVDTASPVWYRMNAAAEVTSFATAGSTTIITGLHTHNIRVVPTVTTTLTPQQLQTVAASPSRRAAHAASLAALALSKNYDGLDLDYESIARTRDVNRALKTRLAYTALVQDVCSALHSIHKTCIITVMPRSSDNPTISWWDRLLPAVYDYAAIGVVADRVRLMAYDEHSPKTQAGPIASLPWVEATVQYALKKISAEKIELGIPLYGYDWGGKKTGTMIYSAATAALTKNHSRRRWDSATASPYFTYESQGRRHSVWYSDAQSTTMRYELVSKYKLAGASLWAASQEDPATWDKLGPRFH